MKLNFRDISIKYKIILIVISTSLIALLLSGFTFFIFDKEEFRTKTIKDLFVLADVIGNNSYAAITFSDSIAANEILNTLRFDKHIRNSYIMTADNKVLTQYCKDSLNADIVYYPFLTKDSVVATRNSIKIIKSIIDEDEIIANIYIDSDLTEYAQKARRLFFFLAIIILSALFIAVLISLQLQKIISEPIFKILYIMLGISKSKDYSVRIEKTGNDEIGALISGFNKMLEQIERQNIDLEFAKNRAESLAKVKEQFLANMSHEIRTPMNAIIGMSHLLGETNLNEEQKTFVKHIKNSSNNLMVLINDILDYSKLEAGKIELEAIDFDLHELLTEIIEVLKLKAIEKNISLILNISDDTPRYLTGDKYRLNQILLNLVGNGIKFTEVGNVTLETKMINETQHSITLLFTVIDTGIGIRKGKIKNIFSSFTQASSDTTRKYGGTGLGLAISKELVELMGGKIFVYSNSNEGSNFSFYLTFKKIIAKIDTPAATVVKKTANENKNKILLVEDNKLNQMFTKKMLEKKGYNVTIAENGKDAIKSVENNNFDIILMDLHMPELDGFETTKHIRSKLKNDKKNIPIIALTGASLDNEKEKCFLAGMNDYIVKPFDPENLVEKIETILKN